MPLIGKDKVVKFINTSKTIANDDLRAVYFWGLKQVIKQTPRDDGRAINNWFLTTTNPSSATTSEDKAGGNSTRQLNGMPVNVLTSRVFFTNNLPYMSTLEYGGYSQPGTSKTVGGFSSQVAPDGWVRKTIVAMENRIRAL
jgi:hypothetical protein